MGVGTYALVTSDEAFNYIGRATADGLSIFSNAVGATAATVTVTDTTMVLVITGGGSAGTTTITFADADSDTLSELITKINAVSGWKATALYYAGAASTDLVVTGALACNTSANEQTLKINRIYEAEKLADRATDLIERWCGRKLKTRTYDRRIYDGNGRVRFILDQYPVTRVGRVTLGRTNLFYVTNTTAKNFATLEVNATQVRLMADGAVTNLTISSYATVTLLVAAISGTAGWSATLLDSAKGTMVPYYTSLDASTKVPEIFQMPSHSCKSPELAYVEYPDEDLEGYYLETTIADEDRNPGMLYYPGGFTAGHQNLAVDFVAGFQTVPAALEEACLTLVKFKYDQARHDLNLQSETIGNVYSYTMADILKGLPDSLREEIELFRSITL